MRIDHIALWTPDLDRCAHFYCNYFGAVAGAKYANSAKGFETAANRGRLLRKRDPGS